ncbi:MAG: DNA polymerase III subunit delta [Solirubrobacterales bacterium]
MADPKPAYLVQGDDEVKIDGWRKRVHDRAAADEDSTIELFADQTPAEEVATAMSAMTLSLGRRWMLVEGVERWKEKDVKLVSAALTGLPPDTIVVMIASGPIRRGKPGPAPAKLVKAVEKCGGEVSDFGAPTASRYAGWAAEQARRIGLSLTPDAAQSLADRVGETDDRPPRLRERRLMRELEKIAIYAPEEGRVDIDTVQELTASDVEARVHQLADALLAGDTALALTLAEDLRDRGTEMMHILYGLLRKVRDMRRVWAMLEDGASSQEVAAALRVPPFIAKKIMAQAQRADGARLERIAAALADLDYAVRGGANVDAGTELTLMVAGAEREGR